MELGIYTLEEMKAHASNYMQDPSTKALSALENAINAQYMQVAQMRDWPELFSVVVSGLSFTAGNPRFYCPKDCMTPIALLDNTNHQFVEPINLAQLLSEFPSSFNDSASVFHWSAIEDAGKERDFSSFEQCSIVSDSAADTSKTIRIVHKPDVSSGPGSVSVLTDSVSGTNVVLNAVYAGDIIRVSSSSARAGVITLSGQVTGNVYARLGPYETTAVYKVLYLTRVPSSANQAVLIYKKSPSRLRQNADIPEIPISHYLRRYAIGYGLQFDGRHSEAEFHFRRANELLEEIMDNSKAGGDLASFSIPRERPTQSMLRYGGYRKSSAG